MSTVDGLILSCGDSMSVLNGLNLLKEMGHEPLLVSGLFTASPLLVEEVREHCTVPVFTLEDFLMKGKIEYYLPADRKVKVA